MMDSSGDCRRYMLLIEWGLRISLRVELFCGGKINDYKSCHKSVRFDGVKI